MCLLRMLRRRDVEYTMQEVVSDSGAAADEDAEYRRDYEGDERSDQVDPVTKCTPLSAKRLYQYAVSPGLQAVSAARYAATGILQPPAPLSASAKRKIQTEALDRTQRQYQEELNAVPRSTAQAGLPARGGEARGAAAGARAAELIFPVTLPVVILTPEQQVERYGLLPAHTPQSLRNELTDYERWQTEPINLERSDRYVRAVQSTTTEKMESVVMGYLGYVSHYFPRGGIISMWEYGNPAKIASFVAYLLARHVQKGHVLKHISVARKVNDFMQSGGARGGEERDRAQRMDAWLGRLEAQINASMAPPMPKAMPDAQIMWHWVDSLVNAALVAVACDMTNMNDVTFMTAWKVERALIAALVCGRYLPPCRIHLIKTLIHPRYNSSTSCMDPDCREPGRCGGNKVEVVEHADEQVRSARTYK